MKILVFSWRDPEHPLAGGAEQVMHEHMKGWIKVGHEVTLFSSRFPGSSNIELIDGVKIVRGGYQYLGVQIKGFVYYLKNRDNVDFLVDQFHGLPFFTPLYSKKPKIAVIQETARGVWLLNPLPRPLNWIIGLIGYLGEPIIFLFYKNTKFITGSGSALEDVVKMGIPRKNITIVPHGVLTFKPSPLPQKEKKKTITFLGVLSKDKGIENALQCFSILNNKGDYQYWVIGKPETEGYKRRIRELVKKLQLENKVDFWGFVDQNKKFELLAKSHVLVNPSSREGWGLVNIEANSVGTPVVAYRSQGLVDSVKVGISGEITKTNEPAALSEGVLDIINRHNYSKISKSAIKWSKNFSWEKSSKASLELIEDIIKKNFRPPTPHI